MLARPLARLLGRCGLVLPGSHESARAVPARAASATAAAAVAATALRRQPRPPAAGHRGMTSSAAPPHDPTVSDEDDDEAMRSHMRAVVAAAAGALYPSFFTDAAAFAAASAPEALAAFTSRLGHSFARPWILRAALTHASFKSDTMPTEAQTMLAWIGDATLQSIASDELVVRYGPAATDGAGRAQAALTTARAHVLSRAGCARNARVLGLDAPGLVVVGDSFKGIGGPISKDMLGEAFEAVIGAVALDGGRAAARRAFLGADPFPSAKLKDLALVYMQPAPAVDGGEGAAGG